MSDLKAAHSWAVFSMSVLVVWIIKIGSTLWSRSSNFQIEELLQDALVSHDAWHSHRLQHTTCSTT